MRKLLNAERPRPKQTRHWKGKRSRRLRGKALNRWLKEKHRNWSEGEGNECLRFPRGGGGHSGLLKKNRSE